MVFILVIVGLCGVIVFLLTDDFDQRRARSEAEDARDRAVFNRAAATEAYRRLLPDFKFGERPH